MELENFCQSCKCHWIIQNCWVQKKMDQKARILQVLLYQNGTFTKPGMTLKEMTTVVITQWKKNKFRFKDNRYGSEQFASFKTMEKERASIVIVVYSYKKQL